MWNLDHWGLLNLFCYIFLLLLFSVWVGCWELPPLPADRQIRSKLCIQDTRVHASGKKRSTVLTVPTSCRDLPPIPRRDLELFFPWRRTLHHPESGNKQAIDRRRWEIVRLSGCVGDRFHGSLWQEREFRRCSMCYIGRSCAERARKFPKADVGPSADPAPRRQSVKSDGQGDEGGVANCSLISQSRKWFSLLGLATNGIVVNKRSEKT